MKIIYVAGGCFWGVEAYYKKLKGIIDTECGYANGNSVNPSYEDLKNIPSERGMGALGSSNK